MSYPGQTNLYPHAGNVQGGQPQDSVYPRTSRSHSHRPSVQTGDIPSYNRSLSTGRTPVAGQPQSFVAYGTGQNREAGLQYDPSTNIVPQHIGAQGQVQSPSYQDPSQAYQPTEQYLPAEGLPPHLVPPQTRSHKAHPQQPSAPQNPSHSIQGQYSEFQRGEVEYPAGHLQQRRASSSQYTQQRSTTELYSQQQQSSQPQYQQQQHQPSTQPYSQHQQSSPLQQRQQYQASSQQYPQHRQQPSSQQYTQQQQHQSSSGQYTTQQQQQPSSQQYAQQHQSQPLRQQGNFTTIPTNAAPSFGASVPSEIYEMPEETRQSRSMRRGTSPLCRLSNCRNPAVREVATQELSEYCSLEHMQEDIQRGATLCPACNKCPRRIHGKYCGSPCEKWDMDRQRQPQQQQQHYPRPPAGARPHLSTPSSSPGNVNWGTAPGESSHNSNYAPDSQHRSSLAGGLVHCPKCNTTYSARGSSRARYGGQGNPVDVPLPPCPTCGFRQ